MKTSFTRSPEEQRYWSFRLNQHIQLLAANAERIHPEYLQGFNLLDLKESAIPNFDDLNLKLKKTAWTTVPVQSALSVLSHAEFAVKKIIPVYSFLKTGDEIRFAADFFSDTVLRLPMLFSKDYSQFLLKLSTLIVQAQPNLLDHALWKARKTNNIEKIKHLTARLNEYPTELTHLSRIYHWTIEHGMFGNSQKYKLYGSKVLDLNRSAFFTQSPLEIQSASTEIMRVDREKSVSENRFFAVPDFSALNKILRDYSKGMAYRYSATDSV